MTAANDSEISTPCPSESAAAWGSFTGESLAVSTIRPGAKTGDIDSGDVGSSFIN
jgi:hypothetical protein